MSSGVFVRTPACPTLPILQIVPMAAFITFAVTMDS